MSLDSGSGKLAENVMHFGRLLRAAGLPLGSQRVQTGLRALQVAGLASRADFRAVLCSCWLDRFEHMALFDQAFDLFWREPQSAGQLRAHSLYDRCTDRCADPTCNCACIECSAPRVQPADAPADTATRNPA